MNEGLRRQRGSCSKTGSARNVIPANAGVQDLPSNWIPASAGMTTSLGRHLTRKNPVPNLAHRLGAGAAGSMLRIAAIRQPLSVFLTIRVAHMLRLVPPDRPVSS